MQVFTTDKGIARRAGGRLELIRTEHGDLYDVICAGRLDELLAAPTTGESLPLEGAVLRAPVRPTRLALIGLNYRSHLEETGAKAPNSMMFTLTDCAEASNGPDAVIWFPTDAPDQVDHECEIALVIRRPAHREPASRAWDVIAGITACNDVSARDIQRRGFASGNFGAGKMLPGFKPFGPGLATSDEVRDAPIPLRLTLNGEERQRADTKDLIYSIPEVIETITASEALEPGDVIITGSPAGVGFLSGRFLRDGDVVEVLVGDLPALRNTFRKG
jgi:2-keto-4-pentenoate hydratase/2-oxohepta-3-ene-1,7-dioic acid hydratase in catechol pathway